MKNIFFILLTCFSIFSLNSCREDGEWGNENGGQFGFTIERDATFIEKAVGETNQLKFNIKPSYDFASIATTFKFTTSLNGTLKLNGETLVANQEYTFSEKNNIFEYIGNVAGTHDLKISVKNEKGASKEEEFSLPYAISDFSHTYSGGTAPIYQNDETVYLMKIKPGEGKPTTGYQIKYNTYNGTVKFNGVPADLDTWYSIPNIESFNTSLATNQAGQGKLTYSIKNTTVSKDYEIQQTVIARTITIESLNINATNVLPNTELSLIGVIKKAPVTTNQTIQYKTWISSASNNNIAGIQNTNNVYTSYALGQNGSINLKFNAIEEGEYTYNFQAKDEFGNESEVKSFTIKVEPAVKFTGSASANITIGYKINRSGLGQWDHISYNYAFSRTFGVTAGGNSNITKVDYVLTYDLTLHGSKVAITRNYTDNVTTGTNSYSVNGDTINTFTDVAYQRNNLSTPNAGLSVANVKLVITAFNSNNQSSSITITPTNNIQNL